MKRSTLTDRVATGLAVFNRTVANGIISIGIVALVALPALAHHPFGEAVPDTFLAGLLSGVGHPVIGLDHLAFVIAVGLLAAVLRQGLTVPAAFGLATLTGTGIHLAGLDLPMAEWVISVSVLVFGLLAIMNNRLNTQVVIGLATLAGVFHGYAYGEAVVGAETTPLIAYLVGFAAVQGAISFGAYYLSKRAVNKNHTTGPVSIRHAGFAVVGAGAAFLGGLLV